MTGGRAGMRVVLRTVLATLLMLVTNGASAEVGDEAEFFEARVRPVLVEHCHACHSSKSPKLKAGLALDSHSGLLKGGESGPVVVPGAPGRSRLIEAVRYDNPELQMPPKRRLDPAQVADLTR